MDHWHCKTSFHARVVHYTARQCCFGHPLDFMGQGMSASIQAPRLNNTVGVLDQVHLNNLLTC